jgi:hypothetical protein
MLYSRDDPIYTDQCCKKINSYKEYLSSAYLIDLLTFVYDINLFYEIYHNKPIITQSNETEYDLIKYLFMLYIKHDLINLKLKNK